MRGAYRSATAVFGLVAMCIGVALVVETAIEGGGIGYLLGVLFFAVGAGRFYLLFRK